MDEYSDFDVFASVELTVDERRALQLAEDLAGALGRIVSWGASRDSDLGEIQARLRDIQHAVMAQAIARAYPHESGKAGSIPPGATNILEACNSVNVLSRKETVHARSYPRGPGCCCSCGFGGSGFQPGE